MRIIFLNTWHSTLRDELSAYVQNNLSSTDVFCFQESREEDRAAYAKLLANDFTLVSIERRNELTGSNYGNAFYVRKTIPIRSTGTLFEDEPDAQDIGLAVYAALDVGGTEVTVCNVHGVPRPGDKLDTPVRVRQTQTILDTFAGQKAVIIGGDFNLLPDTKSVQLFAEHDYKNLISDFAIKTTRNHITFEKYPNNIQLYADYVFASPSVKVKNFVVPAVVVSDHQPLELEVEIETSKSTLQVSGKIAVAEAVS